MPGLPEYDDLIRQQETERRLEVGNQINVDVEKATRVLRLRGQTGLPEEVIANDLDYIEQQTKLQAFDPKKYRESNKKWAEFAAHNPYHLAVLKDDEENMTRTEWVMDALFDWKAVGQASKSSFAMQEIGMIGDRQRRMGPQQGDDERLKELRKYTVDHDFDTSGFKSLVVSLTKQSANFIGSWKQGLRRATIAAPAGAVAGATLGTFVYPGLGTAGGGIAGYGAGFTSGMIGGGFEYSRTVEGGNAYLEYRDLGFTHSDAVWAADIAGNINGLLEAVGGQIIFNKLPGIRNVTGAVGDEVVKQMLGRTTFRQVAGKAVTDWGIGVSGEIVTEISQEAMTIVMGEILKAQNDREDMMSGEEWSARIADIATETLKSTVLLAGIGPGQRLIFDGRRARNGKARMLAFQALGESSKDSKLRKNVPGKYREFVDTLTEEGAVDHMLIDAKRFDTYYQDQGMDPDQVADELGVTNLEEARELGTKVEIPMGAYAEKIAPTEHHSGLINDISAREGDMTAREAEEFESNKGELEKQLEEMAAPAEDAATAATQRIIKDVTGQLVAAGTEIGAAQQQAQIMVGMVNLAERAGMEPEALFERMFAGVRRDLPAGVGFEDVDVLIDPLLDRLRSGDFPTQREMQGQSLVEFIKERGRLSDEGGELAARDFQDLIAKGKKKGRSLDDIAEIAQEAGFIAERDPEMLLEAIGAEKSGKPVFGFASPGDPLLRQLGDQIDELASFIQAEGIDLDVLSNAEVRKLLEAGDKFEQIDTTELDELIGIIEAMTKAQDMAITKGDLVQPDRIDTVLARAAAEMPHIFDRQDFGDLAFTDTVRIQETGETAEVTENVQKVFDRAVKRKNILKRLLDCVSG